MKKYYFAILVAALSCFLLASCLSTTRSSDKSEETPVEAGTTDASDTTTATTKPSETPKPSEIPETVSTEPPATSSKPEHDPSDESRAREILQGMTLEEKVGQMFFVRCPETEAVSAVTTWHLGGYILFARDFDGKTEEQVIGEIGSYQAASAIPMLIGVDEEGGTVVRISKFSQFRAEPFMSPQALFTAGGLELIRSDAAEKADLLLKLGLNVNLAPVCDVSTNPDDFIYARSFGQSAEDTAAYVTAVVEEMTGRKVGCVLKHFPGYGNNVDTHTGISFDNRSYDTFVTSDFLPFSAGINAGAGAVMVSHNIVACMDALLPSSLSPAVHEVLRDELGFTGVIMTDDLYMDAIQDYTGGKEAAVMAVLAGNDMIISTDFEVQIPAVLEAVQNGEISETVINESVVRVLIWKLSLGIIS